MSMQTVPQLYDQDVELPADNFELETTYIRGKLEKEQLSKNYFFGDLHYDSIAPLLGRKYLDQLQEVYEKDHHVAKYFTTYVKRFIYTISFSRGKMNFMRIDEDRRKKQVTSKYQRLKNSIETQRKRTIAHFNAGKSKYKFRYEIDEHYDKRRRVAQNEFTSNMKVDLLGYVQRQFNSYIVAYQKTLVVRHQLPAYLSVRGGFDKRLILQLQKLFEGVSNVEDEDELIAKRIENYMNHDGEGFIEYLNNQTGQQSTEEYLKKFRGDFDEPR